MTSTSALRSRAATAGRFIRRDFEKGYTLVNEPGAHAHRHPPGRLEGPDGRRQDQRHAHGGLRSRLHHRPGRQPDPDPDPDPDAVPHPNPDHRRPRQLHTDGRGSFDVFTSSPTVGQQDWMKAHYWRMRAYAPYFDTRLSWAPKTWAYQSAYGISPGSSVDTQHPDWILHRCRRQQALPPLGLLGGKCSQYAADIGNPSYRQWWLDQARAKLAKGYAGLYIDNVNLYRKVTNGSGVAVDPIDPRTGTVLTEPTWQRYLADEMEAARSAFPTTEFVHDGIWYAGDTTADQLRVNRAASLINVERGVNDRA